MRTRSSRPTRGDIVLYPYLWADQRERGEIAGRKSRPACLVLRLRDPREDIHHLMLVAITSKQPVPPRRALEIPDTERARAGLARYSRAWIIIDEYNYDIEEQSWFFESREGTLGKFSDPFLRQVTDALRNEMRQGAKRVDRTR